MDSTKPVHRSYLKLTKFYSGRVAKVAFRGVTSLWKKRVAPWLAAYRWGIAAGLWLFALALGYVGFSRHFQMTGQHVTTWDLIYLTLQLFVMESGGQTGSLSWQLQTARFLAPAVSLYTALQALALVFREQLQEFLMRFLRGHVIICGISQPGLWLAKAFCQLGHKVVVIDDVPDNETVDHFKDIGAMVIIGNATYPDVLRKARIQTASLVIAIYEDSGVNAEIATAAEGLVTGRENDPLVCIAQIVDSHLFRLLRLRENEMWKDDSVRLVFFDMFERGARLVVDQYPPFPEDCDVTPHVLIVGAGRMGESVLAQVARKWRRHPNRRCERVRVTILDRTMGDRLKYLGGLYPLIEKMCEVRALTIDVTSPEFYEGSFLSRENGSAGLTCVYVCLDSDSLGMDTALSLLESTKGLDTPIVVRMSHQRGLALLINGAPETGSDFSRVKPFGLYDSIWSPEFILGGINEDLARALHRDYSENVDVALGLADSCEAIWMETDPDTQEAFRRHSAQVIRELRTAGYALEPMRNWDCESTRFEDEEVETMAKMRHDYLVGQYEKDHRAYFPYCSLIYREGPPTPTTWERRAERTRDLYREGVRKLPEFLADFDLQVSRLK